MSIKFGSVIILILGLFVAKISIENFSTNSAQARDIATSRVR